MKFSFAPLVTGLLYVVSVVAQGADPTINTPASVVECLPVQLTFGGTKPPFIVTIHPGGHPEVAALRTFPATSATSITWTVDLPAGVQYTLAIRDSAGAFNPSAPFTIQPGAAGCLTSVSGGSPPAASTPAGGSTPASPPASTPAGATTARPTTTAAGTTAATTPAAGGTTSRPATTSGAAPTSSAAGSSAGHIQPVGLAGLLGAVGAVVAMF